MNQTMEELWESSHMSAGHAGYLESLYETYLSNPEELSEEWLVFFKTSQFNQTQMVRFLIRQLLANLKISQEILHLLKMK